MGEKKGRLITVEGTEGVGKSTVMAAVQAWLVAKGQDVTRTREPGGTPVAESIRSLLLDEHDEEIEPMTELLLVFAGRSQHVEHCIKPALARGEWVLTDRFTDASFAYQGGGRGIAQERIQALADWVQGDCVPDLTILLDAPVEVGLKRMMARGGQDRIEKEGVPFFEAIRASYLAMAKASPNRFCVINADQSEEAVLADIRDALSERWQVWA